MITTTQTLASNITTSGYVPKLASTLTSILQSHIIKAKTLALASLFTLLQLQLHNEGFGYDL